MKASADHKGIVTYLLGAGASANALPIASQYSERLGKFIDFLKMHEIAKKNQKEIAEICTDFNWLIELIEYKESTVDSKAKYFFEKKENENLRKIKKLLAFFFNVEQKFNPVDQRYMPFIEKIWPGDKSSLPNSRFRIINWNYDFQIEITLKELANFSNIPFKLFLERQCLPSASYLYDSSKNEDMLENFNTKDFSIIHLNGICNGFEYDRTKVKNSVGSIEAPFEVMEHLFNKNIDGLMEHQLSFYQKFKNKSESYSPAIKFAWEKAENNYSPHIIRKNVVEKASEATEETEMLVVIGYSFPKENLEFDTKIITSMKSLKKIIIQDLKPDNAKTKITKICSEFSKDQKITLEIVKDVNNFFVPAL